MFGERRVKAQVGVVMNMWQWGSPLTLYYETAFYDRLSEYPLSPFQTWSPCGSLPSHIRGWLDMTEMQESIPHSGMLRCFTL